MFVLYFLALLWSPLVPWKQDSARHVHARWGARGKIRDVVVEVSDIWLTCRLTVNVTYPTLVRKEFIFKSAVLGGDMLDSRRVPTKNHYVCVWFLRDTTPNMIVKLEFGSRELSQETTPKCVSYITYIIIYIYTLPETNRSRRLQVPVTQKHRRLQIPME